MIYLDNNATTRPEGAVVDAMDEAQRRWWANPSSVHRLGQEARQQVELARAAVGRLIGAQPKSITFTSGGTEAIDLALRGVLERPTGKSGRRVLVTTAVEHAAVRELSSAFGKSGVEVRMLPIDRHGLATPEGIAAAIDASVDLVSVQWANNETGGVQPIETIGERCRGVGALFHIDGTQWVGKMPTDVRDVAFGTGAERFAADILTFAPHKFHGPKGVGVLWARPGMRLMPRLLGTQEGGRRGGTENVPGIVGAGVAAELARLWLEDASRRESLRSLRDRLESGVLARAPGAVVNGPTDPSRRLWNTTNIGFPRLEAEALLLAMSERGLCASAGAACSSGSLDPSPVLLAMGAPAEIAHGSVRFSLGRQTTAEEIGRAVEIVAEGFERVSASGRAAMTR